MTETLTHKIELADAGRAVRCKKILAVRADASDRELIDAAVRAFQAPAPLDHVTASSGEITVYLPEDRTIFIGLGL